MKKSQRDERESYVGVIVAIDGPSGAGKSTVSRVMAEKMGAILLDTGAMYRAVAYHALNRGLTGEFKITELARRLHFEVDLETNNLRINGEDLGLKIRTEEIGRMASDFSKQKGVRQALTERQREIGKALSKRIPVIAEGRDIGTVVFPEDSIKFFVTASPEVRARRRLLQLQEQGTGDMGFEKILEQIKSRDDQDSRRELAPLKCADDAIVIDTGSLSIDEVVHLMLKHIKKTF